MPMIFRKLACLLLIVGSAAAVAQTRAKTNANVNPRSGPSTDSSRLATLAKNSEVTLLQPNPSSGFYHVHCSKG